MVTALRILAVDLSAMARRHWEASQGRENSETFSRTINEITSLRDGWDRVAICCDAGVSFRRAIDPQYKANRERPPASYGEQVTRIKERLAADGCSIFDAPRVTIAGTVSDHYAEADDVIGALAEWCRKQGHTLRIASGDKDLLQLVSDAVPDVPACDVVRPNDPEPWNEARVEAKIGLPPGLVPAWLALSGDGSDGFKPFPGWEERDPANPNGKPTKRPGIGDKTAVDLLKRFALDGWNAVDTPQPGEVLIETPLDAVKAVLAALDAKDENDDALIKGHVAEVLRRGGIAAAERGILLASLRTDLAINFAVLDPVPQMKRADARDPIEDPTDEPLEAQEESPSPPRASAAMTVRAEPSTAIDRYAFQPRDFDQLWRASGAFFNSRMYPQYGTREAIMVIAIEAAERGVPIGLALRNGYVVKGRPAWSASFLAALVLASGKAKLFRITETTDARAVLEYQRFDETKPSTYEYTIEEAKQAGWLRSGANGDSKWLTNPRTMLRWAAMREGARAFFPDVCAGLWTPDELRNGVVTDDEFERDSA